MGMIGYSGKRISSKMRWACSRVFMATDFQQDSVLLDSPAEQFIAQLTDRAAGQGFTDSFVQGDFYFGFGKAGSQFGGRVGAQQVGFGGHSAGSEEDDPFPERSDNPPMLCQAGSTSRRAGGERQDQDHHK